MCPIPPPKTVSCSPICRQYEQAQNKASNYHESIWGKLVVMRHMWFTEARSSNWVPMATKDLKELHLPWKMQGEVSLRGRPGNCWQGLVPLFWVLSTLHRALKTHLGAHLHASWSTSAQGFRHLPCPQPRTPSSLSPPVLLSSWCWVLLLFAQQGATVSVHTLSLELSWGVLHYPAPLIGWPGGAIAAGECGGSTQEEL